MLEPNVVIYNIGRKKYVEIYAATNYGDDAIQMTLTKYKIWLKKELKKLDECLSEE